MVHADTFFTPLDADLEAYTLPERFTFPFYYEPHPLCIQAAQQLQGYLESQTEWEHNFGLDPQKESMVIGKMFGVLIVQNKEGQLGYLAAFSGKLADSNHHKGFVPPVFDMLTEGSFFNEGIKPLNAINDRVKVLEKNPALSEAKESLEEEKKKAEEAIAECKAQVKTEKKARKRKREEARMAMTEAEFEVYNEDLRKESIKHQYYLKDLIQYWDDRVKRAEEKLRVFTQEIEQLKEERKQRSAALQERLFENYQFLNHTGTWKSLKDIFFPFQPPAGSGECAAPKLLQYAYLHQLKPIAMAEFWWGASPKSEVRKHKQFYPACKGKCEPILGHMLKGLDVDPNPMLDNPGVNKAIETIYEDDDILIIHKPHDLLAVPGKNIRDSVLTRMQINYPDATGPLVVHRLDMATSGLMVIAKNKEAHKGLQYQFIKRKIKKRYVALLDGIVEEEEGIIDLPLRVDLEDRPRQLVCYEYGKSARTLWKVIDRKDGKTRIHFFPITGRTHQLRVHAAHHQGLNCPIIGDDLYGIKGNRLHLHAERMELIHPLSKTELIFEVEARF